MSWFDLDEVFSKAELPEVARRLSMEVERRGANLVAQCPFHEDTQPSLVLYPGGAGSHSHFHCFSCNAHGHAVDLVKKVLGLEFMPAIEWLAKGLGISPRRGTASRHDENSIPRDEALAFAMRVFDSRHDEAGFTEWCKSRKFDRDILFGLGLRYVPAGSVLVQSLQRENFGKRQQLIDALFGIGLLIRLRPNLPRDSQASLNLNEQIRDYFHDGRVLIPIHTVGKKLAGIAGRHWLRLGSNRGRLRKRKIKHAKA